MLGLNINIVVHHLPLRPECKPVKQRLRCKEPEHKIKKQVAKKLEEGFLDVID